MFRQLLAWTFFLNLFSGVSAQVIYERTYNNVFPSMQFPIELADLSTVSFANNGICADLGYRHIDASGNIIQEESIDYEAHSNLGTRWIGHDSVLIWYRQGALDLGGFDSFKIRLWTPDTIIHLITDDAFMDYNPESLYGTYLYTPQEVIYQKHDTFYQADLVNGLLIKEFVVPGTAKAFQVKEGILIFSDQQAPIILNADLNISYSWSNSPSLSFDIDQAVSIDSFLLGKDNSNPALLSFINVYTEEAGQIDLSGFLTEIEDVQINKGKIFVKGFSGNDLYVLMMNEQLNIILQSPLALPVGMPFMTYRYYPDRVYAFRYDGADMYRANYRMSYPYLNAEPVKWLDIALDSVWVDSFGINATQPHEVFASVVVHNLSDEEIHSLTMHYTDYSCFPCFCESLVISEHLTGLSIPPGEADTLHLQFEQYLSETHPFHRVYHIEHGNYHLDADTSNNYAELTFLFDATSDPEAEDITIFPNPFTDELNVMYADNEMELLLYDQTGKLAASGRNKLTNLSSLLPGQYYLRIVSDKQAAVEKVVKIF